jgi:hypothetical protein
MGQSLLDTADIVEAGRDGTNSIQPEALAGYYYDVPHVQAPEVQKAREDT